MESREKGYVDFSQIRTSKLMFHNAVGAKELIKRSQHWECHLSAYLIPSCRGVCFKSKDPVDIKVPKETR